MAGNNNVILRAEKIYKEYEINNDKFVVLNDLNLEVKKGEFISIVGASGCGKSTFLKMISALEFPTSGLIKINNNEVSAPLPEVSMIFQDARLLPWKNIQKNIEFVIPDSKGKKEKHKISDELIKLVGLEQFRNAIPSQLSGGMQQRVNIARGLATSPEILLLDEPFGALDAFTRINMQNELLRIWDAEKTTMILVTHDIDEAIFLSDRIIVVSERPGTVKCEIPIKMERPRNRNDNDFLMIRKKIMMEFLGESNIDIDYYI
jgi:sulfonate transport system ATP-binding protein